MRVASYLHLKVPLSSLPTHPVPSDNTPDTSPGEPDCHQVSNFGLQSCGSQKTRSPKFAIPGTLDMKVGGSRNYHPEVRQKPETHSSSSKLSTTPTLLRTAAKTLLKVPQSCETTP